MSERPTVILATAALAGASAMQALAATRATDAKTALSNATGSSVCLIAFIHYLCIMRPGIDATTIRYSDWLITLPLLLLEIFLICGIDIVENGWVFLLTCILLLAMLLAGWMSVRSKRRHPTKSIQQKVWLLVGCVCLIAVYWIVLSLFEQTKTGLLPLISIGFFSLWSLYGVVAVIDGSHTQYMYDILDLSTKAVFGIIVAIHTFLQLDIDNQDGPKGCQSLPQDVQIR